MLRTVKDSFNFRNNITYDLGTMCPDHSLYYYCEKKISIIFKNSLDIL